ncbi:LLM class flavin-dependent oxidoreductase [Pseudonocardia nematodicida]|uniref:LLM class flavin-dependent oxidoreductase n=1 Tax=Pseudonocardia nematodicida TaxID=1206997 RepID=A0ABV1KE95_9PSEU
MSTPTTSAKAPIFGFSPWRSGVDRAADLLRVAVRADRAGLDLLTVSDHPYVGAKLDAYATLGVVLGATGQITTAVSVTNLPLRPTPLLARTVTSLSALSGGRVVLGLGAGGSPGDIARMGGPALPPSNAVAALEEAIVVLRQLSGGGDPVTFEGVSTSITGIDPAPVAAPPVWTGSVGHRSLQVTGRHADGWIPGHAADWVSPLYRRSRPVIDEAAAGVGRAPAEIRTVFNVLARIADRPVTETRDDDGRWIAGSVDQWIEELTTAVLEHGAAGFVLHVSDATSDDIALGRWAEEIAPAVRVAVGAR